MRDTVHGPLRHLRAGLSSELTGRNSEIARLCSIAAHRLRLNDPAANRLCRPGRIMIAGKPGSGKTHTAIMLARILFGGRILRIDLNEYQHARSLSSLTGWSGGNDGPGGEGIIPAWLRRCGRGVIVFEKVEKAQPAVWGLILGIMEGRTADEGSAAPDARGCLLLFTTNRVCVRGHTGGETCAHTTARTPDLLGRYFPPAFMARLDEVICCRPPDDESLRGAIVHELHQKKKALSAHNIDARFDDRHIADAILSFLPRSRRDINATGQLIERALMIPAAHVRLRHEGTGPLVLEIDAQWIKNRIAGPGVQGE